MGSLGSGRNIRDATKTDDLLSIDLADLKRWGVLDRPSTGRLSWSIGGHVHTQVGYISGPLGLMLHYQSSDSRPVEEFIPFAFTGQHLGGQRAWFTCLHCGGRARILYGGKHFRCRKCYRAVYPSQYTPFRVGKINKALKIRERLNSDPSFSSIDDPFPPKPKGMHWKTYESVITQLEVGAANFNVKF